MLFMGGVDTLQVEICCLCKEYIGFSGSGLDKEHCKKNNKNVPKHGQGDMWKNIHVMERPLEFQK